MKKKPSKNKPHLSKIILNLIIVAALVLLFVFLAISSFALH